MRRPGYTHARTEEKGCELVTTRLVSVQFFCLCFWRGRSTNSWHSQAFGLLVHSAQALWVRTGGGLLLNWSAYLATTIKNLT